MESQQPLAGSAGQQEVADNSRSAVRLAFRRFLGEGLNIVGRLFQYSGVVAFTSGLFAVSSLEQSWMWTTKHPPGFSDIAGFLLLAVLGGVAFLLGRPISRLGRRYATRIVFSANALSGKNYVLYLRSFDHDQHAHRMPFTHSVGAWDGRIENQPFPNDFTEEEGLVDHFSVFGKTVAVGRPGERLPFSGADRMYLPQDNWKPIVSKLVCGARLVVLAAATTDNTLWELAEVRRLLPYPRLVVMLYGREDFYDEFRTAAVKYFDRRIIQAQVEGATVPVAPDFPDPPPPHHHQSSLGIPPESLPWGAVYFRRDGTPQFARFDLSVDSQAIASFNVDAPGRIGSTRSRLFDEQVQELLQKVEVELVSVGDRAGLQLRASKRYFQRLLIGAGVVWVLIMWGVAGKWLADRLEGRAQAAGGEPLIVADIVTGLFTVVGTMGVVWFIIWISRVDPQN